MWGNSSHVGIGPGNGLAVSTLVSSVCVHRVHAVTTQFTTYIRTGLSGPAAATAAR